MLDDWTNEGFDPYAEPDETGHAYGPKRGTKALKRERLSGGTHGGNAW